MTHLATKLMETLLTHFPEAMEQAKAKIEQLNEEMAGAKGAEKKAELDKFIINFVWSKIEPLNNIGPDFISDPITKAIIDATFPAITQKMFDFLIFGTEKLEAAL